jgi:hypothetical protein
MGNTNTTTTGTGSKSAVRLTELETKALRVLFDSADGNGHDFGFIDDLIEAKVMGRDQVAGVVASLAKKGIIYNWGEEKVNWNASYTQFTWGKLFGEDQIYPDSFSDLLRLGNLLPALVEFEGLSQEGEAERKDARQEASPVPRVGVEDVAHMMASFLGQLVDEGVLDSIDEQITMGGMTPKLVASRLLDRFESVAY